jgi:threonine/homoserine/homoserine lactone efflux protein
LFFTRHPANATGDLQSDAPLGSAWLAFGQGVLTNVLNPKVALFFLALLPQFISPASPSKTLAFLALGATFITTGTIWCLILAVGAARLRSFFARNPNVRTLIDRASGGLFMLLGTRLAWSR